MITYAQVVALLAGDLYSLPLDSKVKPKKHNEHRNLFSCWQKFMSHQPAPK